MFIPRGKVLYKNLATSYVLVDSLVADLCEGGFSGVVEVTLSRAQAFVLMARGKVAASLEARDDNGKKGDADRRGYAQTSLKEIAAASRRERGRVSVYSYPAGLAEAVAGHASATPLYTGLSTEFADLGKMISKLARERERQWFIEVRSDSAVAALVHINEGGCRVMSYEEGEADEGSDDSDGGASLARLLEECDRAACTFDVYYMQAADALGPEQQAFEAQPEEAEAVAEAEAQAEDQSQPARDVSDVVMEAKALYSSLSLDENNSAAAGHSDGDPSQSGEGPRPAEQAFGAGVGTGEGIDEDELVVVREELDVGDNLDRSGDATVMAEVKRLMGDIARTIEVAAQAIEQRDSFSIYLRASQLKIADRYPFLDPFGAEFEYLAGEIAFIGDASPDQFVEGLTEALKLALEAVAQTSTQSARLRSRVSEDLRWLYDRHQQEFQRYGLDRTIAELVSA